MIRALAITFIAAFVLPALIWVAVISTWDMIKQWRRG